MEAQYNIRLIAQIAKRIHCSEELSDSLGCANGFLFLIREHANVYLFFWMHINLYIIESLLPNDKTWVRLH